MRREEQQRALALRKVQAKAREFRRVRDEFEESVRKARAEGVSLRAIGESAGLGKDRIAQILAKGGGSNG